MMIDPMKIEGGLDRRTRFPDVRAVAPLRSSAQVFRPVACTITRILVPVTKTDR